MSEYFGNRWPPVIVIYNDHELPSPFQEQGFQQNTCTKSRGISDLNEDPWRESFITLISLNLMFYFLTKIQFISIRTERQLDRL